MEIGLLFAIIYTDSDLVEVRITAWNGIFGGTADVYLGTNQLGDVATQLQNFPCNCTDVREVTLGSFGQQTAGGGVKLRFFNDKSCHAHIEARIESGQDFAGITQFVAMLLPIEAASLDSFVLQLRAINEGNKSEAKLVGAICGENLGC